MLLCEFSQSIQTLKRSVLGFEKHKLTDSFGFIVAESSQRPIHRKPLSQVTASQFGVARNRRWTTLLLRFSQRISSPTCA
jgi:hypothetical protein